jgi:chemotaxis response regulator CheB
VHLFPNDAGPTNIPIRIEKEPKMATSKKTANVAAKTPSKQAKKKITTGPKKADGFYIVGIGASAGGLEAF